MDDAGRARYLDSLVAVYGSLTLPLTASGATLPLGAVFQPLRLRHDPLAADDLAQERRRKLLRSDGAAQSPTNRAPNAADAGAATPQVTASDGGDALAKSPSRRLVILGGPGVGKTTTLKHLLASAIQRARDSADEALPIFVAAPDLARSAAALDAYLARQALSLGVAADDAASLWQAIQSGQAFVCLDSLDEVAPAQRGALISQINEWAGEPGNTWVIGSRFTEYKGGQFAHARFAEWELEPLGHEQRMELARRLLPILGDRLNGGRADAPRLSPTAFVVALEERPQAEVWRDNPLLVSLAAVVFARRGVLPQSHALLFREASDAILATREPDATRREELRGVLAEVALRLYSGAGRVFTRADALATLTSIQQEQPAEWSPDDLTQRIIASGALDVISPTDETYAFFHQTFQEYLAGVGLARRLLAPDAAQGEVAWQFAWSKRLYSRWTEIMRLLAPILTQEDAASGPALALRWLRALMGQRESADGDVGDLGLSLAIATLAEAEGLPDTQTASAAAWRELRMEALRVWVALMSEAVRAKRFPRQRRLKALSDDIGRVVVQLEQSAAPTFEADMQRLIEPLTALLASRDQFVSPQAMEALIPFGAYAPLPSLVALACAKTRRYGGASRGVYMYMEEAEFFGRMDHPGIHQALRDLLGSDYDGDRVVAVVALGNRGALLLPDDVARLIGALGDPSLYVRMRAIRVLGAIGAFLSSAETDTASDALVALAINPTADASKTQFEDRRAQDDEARINIRLEQSATIMLLALQALSQLNPAALARIPLEPYIALLGSQAGGIRLLAVQMLSQFGERAPYDLLAATLSSEEWVLGNGNGSHGAMLFAAPNFAAGATELGRLGERIPVEPMIRLLRHDHPQARTYALKALDAAQGRAPVELIREAVESSYPEVRQAAVGLLARSKHKGTLPVIRVELTEPMGGDASEQSHGYSSHERSNRLRPPNGIERLTVPSGVHTLLRPPRYDTAGWAETVIHLPDGRDERLCEAMFGVLEASDGFATPDGVATLEALLNDPIRKLRPRALESLGSAGALAPVATLLDALATTTGETLWQGAAAIAALGALGTDEAIAALLPIARSGPDHPLADLRPNALDALGKACPHPSAEVAAIEIEGVRSDDNDVFGSATESIKQWKSVPAISDDDLLFLTNCALNANELESSHSISEAVYEMCQNVIPHIAYGPHIALLNEVALHDPDERRRGFALGWLGDFGDAGTLETLFAGLDEAKGNVRIWAMQSLIKRYERAPDETLRVRLIADGTRLLDEERRKEQRSDREQMCAQLTVNLVRLGAPVLTETLADLTSKLERDHPWWPREAFGLLCRLGEHAPVELLVDQFRRIARETANYYTVIEMIESLNGLDERTPYALFAELLTGKLLLVSADERTAPYALVAAVEALQTLGSRAPIAPFLAAAHHPDDTLRAKAIEALGELFPQESAAIILAAFDGEPGDIAAAAKASRHLGAQAPIARLLALLGDTNHVVREAAAESLALISPDHMAAVRREAMGILLGEQVGDSFSSLSNTQLAQRLGSVQRSYPTLLAKLADLLEATYWETQLAAANSLGSIRRNIPDRAIRRLWELRRGAASVAVRNAAEDALAEILTIESGLEDDTAVAGA